MSIVTSIELNTTLKRTVKSKIKEKQFSVNHQYGFLNPKFKPQKILGFKALTPKFPGRYWLSDNANFI